jgi:hypothetical protein
LRNENAPTQEVWNYDGTLLAIFFSRTRSGDPSNSCRSMLIDVDGSHGVGAWRVLRASGSSILGDNPGVVSFWDYQDPPHGNPLRMFGIASNGAVNEWWPIGGDGHSVGEVNRVWGPYPSGFTAGGHDTYWLFTSRDGRYFASSARRSSDGHWGAFRRDLRTGALGPFVPSAFPQDTPNLGGAGISMDGQYTSFANNGNEFYYYSLVDGHAESKTPAGAISHQAWAEVNGRQIQAGAHSNNGYRAWDILSRQLSQIIDPSDMVASNPHHTSTLNYLDRFETYGGTGSGATSGHRYAIFGRARSASAEIKVICGIRLGPNDYGNNVGRVICCHRSLRSGNEDEAHFQPTREMSRLVFASNWALATGNDDGSAHAYVVEIPDGWKSPNNDGS